MKKLVLMIAILLPMPALAQGYTSSTSSCSVGSMAWAPATEEDCRSRGGVFYSGAYGRQVFTVPSGSAIGKKRLHDKRSAGADLRAGLDLGAR